LEQIRFLEDIAEMISSTLHHHIGEFP